MMIFRSKILAAVLCLFLLGDSVHAAEAKGRFESLAVPVAAPPLVFESEDHTAHALREHKGHFVLLTLWATWCGPCVKEMPALDALALGVLKKSATDGLEILPLSEDRDGAVVRAFYTRHGLKALPVMTDKGGIAPEAFHIKGLPTSYLLDPRGRIIARFDGAIDWTALDVRAFLQAQMRGAL